MQSTTSTSLPLPQPVTNIADMEPSRYIGKTGNLVVSNPDPRRDTGELRVKVKIMDARSAYGRIDVEVTPVKGSGKMWVSLSKLEGVK